VDFKIKTSKFAILIDTCESGSVAQQSFASSIQRFGTDSGVAIIAGVQANRMLLMGIKNMEFFTYTILDAMKNKKVYRL